MLHLPLENKEFARRIKSRNPAVSQQPGQWQARMTATVMPAIAHRVRSPRGLLALSGICTAMPSKIWKTAGTHKPVDSGQSRTGS